MCLCGQLQLYSPSPKVHVMPIELSTPPDEQKPLIGLGRLTIRKRVPRTFHSSKVADPECAIDVFYRSIYSTVSTLPSVYCRFWSGCEHRYDLSSVSFRIVHLFQLNFAMASNGSADENDAKRSKKGKVALVTGITGQVSLSSILTFQIFEQAQSALHSFFFCWHLVVYLWQLSSWWLYESYTHNEKGWFSLKMVSFSESIRN